MIKWAWSESSIIIIQKQEIKCMKLQSQPQQIYNTFIDMYQQPKIETNNSLLIKIKPYSFQGKIFILIIKGVLQVCILLISLLFYICYNIDSQVSTFIAVCESFIKTSFLAYRTLEILIGSYLLSIIAIQNIVIQHFLKINKYKLLQYVNKKLDSLLIVGLELNIVLSALILLLGNQMKLALMINFALSCLISIFVDGFMQCTGKPSDILCTSNHKFIVLLRVLSILNLILSISKKLFQLNQVLILVVAIVSCIIVSSKYIQSGYRTYKNYYSRCYLLILVTMFISITVTMILQYILIISFSSILSVAATVFISLKTKTFSMNAIIDLEKYDLLALKNFQSCVAQTIQNGQIERNCLLLGLIQMHKTSNCSNIHCFTHKEQLYCPQFDCQVNMSSLKRYDIIIKYLVKCLYQQLNISSPQNAEIALSYCEYSYYQMKNILPLAIYLHKIEGMALSLYQRMRLYGLKLGLKQDVKKMNPIQLNNDVQFQKIVAFDEIYSQVAQANSQSIKINKILWDKLSQSEIEIQSIISIVQQIELNRKKIERYWATLQKYIDIWPHLKKIHAFYSLFLTNSFKKQKVINELGQNCKLEKDKQRNFNYSKTFITKSDAFNQNSIVIHNILQSEKLVIKKCSKSIQKILGYLQDQLNSCDLSLIMPKYFRNYHDQKFNNWMDQGFVNLQKFQKGVDLFCVNKAGIMINIVKTFKLFANQSGQIEFVCLLLIQPGQQSITAICDLQTNTIEEVTSNFLNHLQINMIDIVQRTQNISNFLPNINDLVCQLQTSEHTHPFQLQFSSSATVYNCIISRVASNPKKYQIDLKNILPQRHYVHGSMQFVRPVQNNSKTLKKTEVYLKKKPEKLPSNIFMKQQGAIPNNSLKQIKIIKYTLHTFVTLLLTMFVIIMLISNQNYISLETHVEQHLNLIVATKQPLLLGIKYYEAITGLQKSDVIDSQIERSSNIFAQTVNNANFLKTLFDPFLFSAQPLQRIATINESSQNLTNRDIFYIISSSVASLKPQSRSFQTTDFLNFNQFILDFYQILDETKDNMHQSYSSFYKNIEIPSIIFIQFQCGLFLLVFSIATYYYIKVCRKMKEIFEIMMKLDKNELKQVKKYWDSLENIYFRLSSSIKCKQQEQSGNVSSKKIVKPGKKLKTKERIIFLSGVVSLLLKFIITGILQIYVSSQIKDIQSFGSLSSIYFDFYPSNLLAGYGVLKKYYHQSQNETHEQDPFYYQQTFEDIDKINGLAYISATDSKSPFFSTLKNYYFGNPCKYNPEIIARLNISERDCTINGGFLSNGIVSYGQSIRIVQEKYLKNNINLSKFEIYNQTKWTIVANDYIEDLISLWGDSFIAEIESARTGTIYLYCSMFVLVIVIHYAIAHKTFICSIDRYYQHYVNIYDVVVSKDRSDDKIVKSELMSYSFVGR